MDARAAINLTSVVLGAREPVALAGFYRELLGWERHFEEPDWVMIRPPGGGVGLSFQGEPDHVPPAWPAGPSRQQMQMHLDLRVEDLGAACAHAERLGASRAGFQPQRDVRVYLDPEGHPFCLFED
ncbi:VOC family protein [Arthrobacter halodurans]|uniref:VOC family protein n=1 Tax=Arthrobacter halodurans TaxID=516699 RepID=A0ABV4UKX9_9MICC